MESQGTCDANCNTVEDPFGRICGPSKIEDNKFCDFGKYLKNCTCIMCTDKTNYWLLFDFLLAIACFLL